MMGSNSGNGRRGIPGPALLALGLLGLAASGSGCYDQRSGNPVDRHHYDHVITLAPDYSHASIKTYVNRTHLIVGIRREDIFDGDRDGQLVTPGMDRVHITDYMRIEDPPESAERRMGDIRAYDDLFQRILGAAGAGKPTVRIDDRDYRIRLLSASTAYLADEAR